MTCFGSSKGAQHEGCLVSQCGCFSSNEAALQNGCLIRQRGCGCREWALSHVLQKATRLTHLNVKNCWYLPAKALTSLQNLPDLASLNIAIYRRMTIPGLGHLQVQPNLRFQTSIYL